MINLIEREILFRGEAPPGQLLAMKFDPEGRCPNLQANYITSQERSRSNQFDISQGKFPLMKEAGEDVCYGWMIDAFAPKEFWGTRAQEIIQGKVCDNTFFVPLIPDLYNSLSHPKQVLIAVKEWRKARKKYGDNFQFVFTYDEEKGHYIKTLYVFSRQAGSLPVGLIK